MTAMELGLRPATTDEVNEWLPWLAARYAAEIAASGSLPSEQAQAKAHRDLSELRKDGPSTAGQLSSVGLNVHGSIAVAQHLYDSLGYQVTTQQMKKSL